MYPDQHEDRIYIVVAQNRYNQKTNSLGREKSAHLSGADEASVRSGVRFSNALVNLRIEYNACKNLRIATIFVILELHLMRIVTDCVCEILLQWRSVATMQNVQCC
jgi:hypothetical protein